MQIIKRILIKQVITEKSKKLLREKFEREITQLERECQQLLFEQRKLKNRLHTQKQEISDRFQQEIKHRKDKMTIIEFKIEQLDLLELGSEIIEKEVDGLVDVDIGSNWNEIVGKHSIVIEDDKVIRIDKE
jgi:hypothetical protein